MGAAGGTPARAPPGSILSACAACRPEYSPLTTSAACEAARLQGEFALPRLPTHMRTQDPETRMRVCWKSVDYLNACLQMPRTARLGQHNATAQWLQSMQLFGRMVRQDRSKLHAGVREGGWGRRICTGRSRPPPSPNRLCARSRRVPGNFEPLHRPPKTLARSPCGSCDCFQVVMCMTVANYVIWQLGSGWKHVCASHTRDHFTRGVKVDDVC